MLFIFNLELERKNTQYFGMQAKKHRRKGNGNPCGG
jgi:hypothetical protein